MKKTKKLYLFFICNIFCTAIFSQTSGHLKFGLLSFEIVDSSADRENMILLKKRFEKSLSHDVYFNQDTLLEIRTKEDLNISYKIFYDSNYPNVVLFFLNTPEGNYFVRDTTVGLVQNSKNAKKDKKTMEKLFKSANTEEDRKTILGLECNRVTMMDPVNNQSDFFTAYIAPVIPNYSSSSNPLSTLFSGYPLETTMMMDGYKISWGAILFEPLDTQQNIFVINKEDYIEIGREKLKDFMLLYLGEQ